MNDDDEEMTPMAWLGSVIDLPMINKGFKVINQEFDSIRILHKETGAVWEFKAEVIRVPAK